MKEVAGCVQSMVGVNNLQVKSKDGEKIEIGYFLLTHVCSEEEVDHAR